MKKHFIIPAILSVALVGCATDGGYYSSSPGYYGSGSSSSYNRQYAAYGVVESVRTVSLATDTSGIGGGAVLGAVVGGLLGNQVGGGSGRTAATIAGAAAGGYVGDRIQDNNNRNKVGQEISVRLDNGSYIRVIQPGTAIYHNARVRVEGSGTNTRVYLDR